jgi:hypothetical protein
MEEMRRRRVAMRGSKKKEDNYSMSEKESTDEDEDEEDFSPERSYKRIPDWCRDWIGHVQVQGRYDPDAIFGTKIRNPDLATIFGTHNVAPKRRKRGESSSGTLSCFWASILPQIGCLCIRDFSKESEHFLG